MSMSDAIDAPCFLDVRDVRKHYPVTSGVFHRETGRCNVLNGVSLRIREGEIFGLVGESGCGKSTLAKILVKLTPPSSGDVIFLGSPLSVIARRDRRDFYGKVQMVFQDPYSSLNPRLTVGEIVGEMARIRGASRNDSVRETHAMLRGVGLPGDVMGRRPHELSGGQRQRVAIARALIVKPRLLIADEPVSALDLSTQAMILELLQDLKEKLNLTILFISHDLDVVAAFCDRAAVMHLGCIVEVMDAGRIFESALHPYSRALLDSIPIMDPALRQNDGTEGGPAPSEARRRCKKRLISGEPPSPLRLPSGCTFHPRCPLRMDVCAAERPKLLARGDDSHTVACWHPDSGFTNGSG